MEKNELAYIKDYYTNKFKPGTSIVSNYKFFGYEIIKIEGPVHVDVVDRPDSMYGNADVNIKFDKITIYNNNSDGVNTQFDFELSSGNVCKTNLQLWEEQGFCSPTWGKFDFQGIPVTGKYYLVDEETAKKYLKHWKDSNDKDINTVSHMVKEMEDKLRIKKDHLAEIEESNKHLNSIIDLI